MSNVRKQAASRHGGGRPPKYPGPRRVVTLTLPERTLDQLAALDADRGRAIVQIADAASGGQPARPQPAVEVVRVGRSSGLIIVAGSKWLNRIPFLQMVEVAPGRHLITLHEEVTPDALEVALMDLLEDIPADEPAERSLVEELRRQITGLRRSRRVSKAEILFVCMP